MCRRFVVLCVLLSALPCGTIAATTRFVVANLPYSNSLDASSDSYVQAVVREVARRLDVACHMEIQPLNRALASAQRSAITLTFPVARTPQREPMFQWLLPLLEDDYVLVSTRPVSTRAVATLSVGVVRGSMLVDYAAQSGYVHLDQSVDESENLRKLLAGRFDVWLTSRARAMAQIRSQGRDPGQFHFSAPLRHFVIYVAASRRFDPRQARRWRLAYVAMQQDGTLARIRRHYRMEGRPVDASAVVALLP